MYYERTVGFCGIQDHNIIVGYGCYADWDFYIRRELSDYEIAVHDFCYVGQLYDK